MEQLLISSAAERAADRLSLTLPANANVFVDSSNFEGTDSKNALGAIRAALLKQGMRLVDDKKKADTIVEPRAGALSLDKDTFLIGIPQFSFPVPLASGPLTIPEIALYSKEQQKGIAKFAVAGYDARTGTLLSYQEPQFGFSHNTKKTAIIFISWTDNDVLPDEGSEL
jgi:hypothetical protein